MRWVRVILGSMPGFDWIFFDSVLSVTDGGELIGKVDIACFHVVRWFLDLTIGRDSGRFAPLVNTGFFAALRMTT